MTRLEVLQDDRTAEERRLAVDTARADPEVAAILDDAVAKLVAARDGIEDGSPGAGFWGLLDQAYARLDEYLAALVERAKLRLSCASGCSTCCTDLPWASAIEGIRMARSLRGFADGPARVQRTVQLARKFQGLLQQALADQGAASTSQAGYVAAQLTWRTLGYPCPVLDDDGRCGHYGARPLACRTYVSIEDPDHCRPASPAFTTRERPTIWVSEAEARFERTLKEIGERLGLPGTPNLQWAVALLHDHPLAGA